MFCGRRDVPDLDLGRTGDRALATRSYSTAPVLLAIDKRTGGIVKAVELPASPTGAPMTYLADGRQLVVLAYGTTNDAGLIALALP